MASPLPPGEGQGEGVSSAARRYDQHYFTGAQASRRAGWPRLAVIGLGLVVLAAGPARAIARSYRAYVVLTGSMAPNLPVGTLIVAEPVDATDVAAGDVITFPRPDRQDETVTHRVISVDVGPTGRFLRTKGDANNTADAWRVPATGRILRLAFALPSLGPVFQAANDTSGRMALMVLPSLFLGAMTLFNTWRGDKAPTVAA